MLTIIFDFIQKLVRVVGKGNKERLIPLSEKSVIAINSWISQGRTEMLGAADDNDFVFLNLHLGLLILVLSFQD